MWALYAVGLWIWHLPYLYEWALQDPLVHDIEHLTFFIVSCLFWRVTLDVRVHLTLNPAASVLYLFTTSLHTMALGVLMALSPRVWYKVYVGRTEGWGLSPLEDQQLAGLIMWMPGCIVYAVVAAALFARWLDQAETNPNTKRRRVPPKTSSHVNHSLALRPRKIVVCELFLATILFHIFRRFASLYSHDHRPRHD